MRGDGDIGCADGADTAFGFGHKDLRGWAMRHGHSKRLRRVTGTGRESHRGRTTYARTVNRCPRMTGHRCAFQLEAKMKGRRCAERELRMLTGERDALCEGEALVLQEVPTGLLASALAVPLLGEAELVPPAAPDGSDALAPRRPALRRSTSAPCTAAEHAAVAGREAMRLVPLRLWRALVVTGRCVRTVVVPSRATPWACAMQRARDLATTYVKPGAGGSFGRQHSHQAKDCESGSDLTPFHALRRDFLSKHGEVLRMELSAVFDGPVELKAAPTAPHVVQRFMDSHRHAEAAQLVPVYHGTNAANHSSIFSKGLLVPGYGSGIRSLHGLTHGEGIYTSTVGNAWLSQGFCTEPRMLVCGVLDDAVPINEVKVLGRFQVSKESESVRHIGAAIVVFDPARIVPLFEARARPLRPLVLSSASAPATFAGPIAAPQASDDTAAGSPPPRKSGPSKVRCQPELRPALAVFLERRAARKRRS